MHREGGGLTGCVEKPAADSILLLLSAEGERLLPSLVVCVPPETSELNSDMLSSGGELLDL